MFDQKMISAERLKSSDKSFRKLFGNSRCRQEKVFLKFSSFNFIFRFINFGELSQLSLSYLHGSSNANIELSKQIKYELE